jgi:hypothetical protein
MPASPAVCWCGLTWIVLLSAVCCLLQLANVSACWQQLSGCRRHLTGYMWASSSWQRQRWVGLASCFCKRGASWLLHVPAHRHTFGYVAPTMLCTSSTTACAPACNCMLRSPHPLATHSREVLHQQHHQQQSAQCALQVHSHVTCSWHTASRLAAALCCCCCCCAVLCCAVCRSWV